jgi:hypothetical protein
LNRFPRFTARPAIPPFATTRLAHLDERQPATGTDYCFAALRIRHRREELAGYGRQNPEAEADCEINVESAAPFLYFAEEPHRRAGKPFV